MVKGAPGIDPDIFFDDDGKIWYVGNHGPENPRFNGEGEIWLQELEQQTGYDDLVSYVYRYTMFFYAFLDNLNGSINTSAEAAGSSKPYL